MPEGRPGVSDDAQIAKGDREHFGNSQGRLHLRPSGPFKPSIEIETNDPHV
jgi:hypothetical protein